MQLTVKIKTDSGKYKSVDMPPVEKITPKHFAPFVGQPAAVEFQDVHRAYYAYGNEDIHETMKKPGRVCMDMEAFVNFWHYRLLDFGLDTFAKIENYEEREAIMTAEGATPAEVKAHTETRPDLYQEPEFEYPADF